MGSSTPSNSSRLPAFLLHSLARFGHATQRKFLRFELRIGSPYEPIH